MTPFHLSDERIAEIKVEADKLSALMKMWDIDGRVVLRSFMNNQGHGRPFRVEWGSLPYVQFFETFEKTQAKVQELIAEKQANPED